MYEQALDLAKQWGGQPSIPLSLVQRGRAGLLYEWNALDQAASALQESIRIGKLWNSPYFLVHPYGLSAMVLQARGNMDGALAMIQRAEQITRESHATPLDIGLLALYQIALWIAQNDYQTIAQWEQDHDTEWRSRIGRVRDHLALVLAHAYIARYYQLHENSALDKAGTLIEPLVEKAQTSGLMFYETRFIILEALIRYAQGQTVSAISTLKRALALAEPENYFRCFIDLGKPMEELLRRALESQSLDEPHLAAYVGRLLSQFSIDDQNVTSQPANDALIEPLADRELEILKLIAQGLSNRAISERLFLASGPWLRGG